MGFKRRDPARNKIVVNKISIDQTSSILPTLLYLILE